MFDISPTLVPDLGSAPLVTCLLPFQACPYHFQACPIMKPACVLQLNNFSFAVHSQHNVSKNVIKNYVKNDNFIYLGFYVAFNTVQVISRRVVGRAEETSTYSSLGLCTVNCQPTASNYQLSHLRP